MVKVEIELSEVEHKLLEAMARKENQHLKDYLHEAIVTWLVDDLQEYGRTAS